MHHRIVFASFIEWSTAPCFHNSLHSGVIGGCHGQPDVVRHVQNGSIPSLLFLYVICRVFFAVLFLFFGTAVLNLSCHRVGLTCAGRIYMKLYQSSVTFVSVLRSFLAGGGRGVCVAGGKSVLVSLPRFATRRINVLT